MKQWYVLYVCLCSYTLDSNFTSLWLNDILDILTKPYVMINYYRTFGSYMNSECPCMVYETGGSSSQS